MNKYDRIDRNNKKRNIRQLVDMVDLPHKGSVRVRCNESFEHFMCKASYCYFLHKLNIPYITEATIKQTGRIVDIFRLDNGGYVEIETGKSYAKNDGSEVVDTKVESLNIVRQLNGIS